MPHDSQTTPFWYALKLDEMHAPDDNSIVIRVPGGWLYGNMQGTCFIPFNDEFQPVGPIDENLPF